MSYKELYTVRTSPHLGPNNWEVLKCERDDFFSPTGKYQVTKVGTNYECTCPAAHKPTCRHRMMIPEFEVEQRINSHWWFNFDKKRWIEGPKNDL